MDITYKVKNGIVLEKYMTELQSGESLIEHPLELNCTDISGAFKYEVVGGKIVERDFTQDEIYLEYILNKQIIPELDEFLNQGYRTFGKGGIVPDAKERFRSLFGTDGKMSYNNEFHNSSDFTPELNTNFKYSNKELIKFNDLGIIFVDDINEDAEIIINTGISANKIILASISMVMEAGYEFGDIEISFKRGSNETPITPFGYAPFSVFGYADLTGQSGHIKIHLKLKAGNATRKAVFDNLVMITEV